MGAIGYNKDWAAKVGKARFVKEMDEYHPGYNHEAAYDELFPPEKAETVNPPKPKKIIAK